MKSKLLSIHRMKHIDDICIHRREDDAVVASVAEVRTVHLHAEANVPGQLAFRLVGNRSSGVYVFGMLYDSQQASILEDGDKLLNCNGISLAGFTCEQVANVLRLSLLHDGTLTMTTSRNILIKEKMEQRKQKRIIEEISCVDRSHPIRVSSPYRTREYVNRRQRIAVFEAERESPKRKSTAGGGVSSLWSNLSLFNLLRGSENHHRSHDDSRQKRESVSYFPLNGQSETDLLEEDQFRCPVCLKYTSMRRLHMLRHEWFQGARRLIPASTSEFFMGRSTSEYAML